MITICIPIYNQDVNNLVDTIIAQCEKADIQFQVLCFDDCSNAAFKELNKDLSLKVNVNYTELSQNVGRAKIRNKMARLSRFDFMLFLDGDSGIEDDQFMQRYIDLVYKQSVVYGGRIYQKEKPSKEYLLHWNYGKKVESLPLRKRTIKPYQSFLTNNFMVTAKVMHEFPFDEKIQSYGYEDLEWAQRLEEKKIFIHHIENPTVHLGLESNESFVNKTIKSIQNLAVLYRENKISSSRLINFHKKWKDFGLLRLFLIGIADNSKDKLIANGGSLRLLQRLKLYYFDQFLKEEQ